MLPTIFSFDRCRDDCAKREEMRTPGEIGFWGGGAGGGASKKFYMGRLGQRSNSLIPYPLYLQNLILYAPVYIFVKSDTAVDGFGLNCLAWEQAPQWGKKTKKKKKSVNKAN